MQLIKVFLLGFVFYTLSGNADVKDSTGRQVELISIYPSTGKVHVRLIPRPDISGLTCTSDSWLTLGTENSGREEALSILLAAKVAKQTLTVRADDKAGDSYCDINRIIME